MSGFPAMLAENIENYIRLRGALGYAFRKQAATLRAFQRYVQEREDGGPLTQNLALAFVLASGGTVEGHSIRYGVLRRFAEYMSVHDPRTGTLDPKALPRFRAVPPPRILTEEELGRLLNATLRVSLRNPLRGRTLHTIVGLLASTGLRSGEALRLDRADVDWVAGVLHVRKSKFRKDRLVPVHSTTLDVLRAYDRARVAGFPAPKSPAFFLSQRGVRLSSTAMHNAFRLARSAAELDEISPRVLRPHDLRHRFAVERLAIWHREGLDVQALLPLLATYLGHVRYSDTAYYVTGTANLLGIAAERAFGAEGGAT